REHIVQRRPGERGEGGKAREEAAVVGNHHLDAGLLQHHFADPDAIGMARLSPPGQVAPGLREPTQQRVASARHLPVKSPLRRSRAKAKTGADESRLRRSRAKAKTGAVESRLRRSRAKAKTGADES